MTTSSRPRVTETVPSRAWDGEPPSIAALVTTYRRSGFLPGLVVSLEAQDLDYEKFEVIIVDNGSDDDTWSTLVDIIAGTPLRALAVRLSHNRGPGTGRNAGARLVRAPLLAITDDDCLPSPLWLRTMRGSFISGADIVQGAVQPDPAVRSPSGPWDHTQRIRNPTPFFETCNVAYRRDAFERAGGFDEDDPLLHPASGRAFGEDACLAWKIQETGGTAAWSPRALVFHRWVPSDFARRLADLRELEGFPGLARRSPLVNEWLHRGVFLDTTTMRFDLALLGLAAAAINRRPWPLLAVSPWLVRRLRESRRKSGTRGDALALLVKFARADSVAFAAMARGSVRHRKVVL